MAGLALAAAVAIAGEVDPRGWSTGPVAANAPRVAGPAFEEAPPIALPGPVAKRIQGPTLLVYFSPGCPHCKAVAPELARLAEAVSGQATLLGVASGSATPAEIAAFRETFGWGFEVVHDADRRIGAAMGARSTPSALLVDRVGGRVEAVDAWYPYTGGSDVLVRMRLAGSPFAVFAPHAYQGDRACFACHTAEAEAWTLSHHSIAWHTLVEAEATDDASCTPCHVTGAGRPGGWDGSPATERLRDVGCEACHGPGGPHDGHPTEPRSTCEGCHDDKHSIAFSYEKGLPLIDHFRTVDLDADAYRTARRALIAGEVDRPLLAFADGPRAPATRCATCHEAAHAAWQASPHGRAMATLHAAATETTAPAQDVACVRCHATATVSGPAPDALTAYRVDEGVGCEACHGPGGDHVASGGEAPIEGLGEDCPVCVIEAVCTRCHTADRDPDWDLERDLTRLKGHGPVSGDDSAPGSPAP